MKRIALLVYVDLDPTPGAFHTEESAIGYVGVVLEQRLNHYNPKIMLAPDSFQPSDNREGIHH